MADPTSALDARRPPLDGVRILTISQFGAGPFGTEMLADLGTDVIEIEDPAVGGDVARCVPPFAGQADSPTSSRSTAASAPSPAATRPWQR